MRFGAGQARTRGLRPTRLAFRPLLAGSFEEIRRAVLGRPIGDVKASEADTRRFLRFVAVGPDRVG